MSACGAAMAAGGPDPRSGDVEEDASQLVFPKGGPWGCPTTPPFGVVTTGLVLPHSRSQARQVQVLRGLQYPALCLERGCLGPSARLHTALGQLWLPVAIVYFLGYTAKCGRDLWR